MRPAPVAEALPAEGVRGLECSFPRVQVVVRGETTRQVRVTGELQGGTLVAERRGEVLCLRVEPAGPSKPRGVLRLAVPEDLEEVAVDTEEGAVRVENLGAAASLRVRTGTGEVQVRDVGGPVAVRADVGQVTGERLGPTRVETGVGDVTLRQAEGDAAVQTGVGKVVVHGVRGALTVRTGTGDISAGAVQGEASLHTGVGDIHVAELGAAALRAHTGTGEIRVEGSRVEGAHLHTGVGDVRVRAGEVAGVTRIESGRGDVDLRVWERMRGRLEVWTGRGRVRSNLPLVRVRRPGRPADGAERWVGPGEPEAALTVRTGMGDVDVHVGAGADGTAPGAAAGADPRRDILERLRRGEISVEEAERLLDQSSAP